jgi:hypothetical protein
VKSADGATLGDAPSLSDAVREGVGEGTEGVALAEVVGVRVAALIPCHR